MSTIVDNVAALTESLEAISRAGDIDVEKDGDYVIDNAERLTFECKAVLGKGGYAVVEKVQHTITKAVFAKKVIWFPREKAKGREKAIGRYHNEAAIIRSLKSHRHIIELFATYMTPRSGGLILRPAANQGDLQQYLDSYADALDNATTAPNTIVGMSKVLEQAFGCLASGLAYMHGMGIRHKDVKPGNVLIHNDTVIYTDFGASKDTTEDGQCTTEGKPDFWTRKYSAPEVLEYEKRNFAADVYSLGRVFVEILLPLSRLTEHQDSKVEGCSGIVDELDTLPPPTGIPSKLLCIREVTILMISKEASSRPGSAKIATEICSHKGLSCLQCFFIKTQVQPLQLQPPGSEPPAREPPTPDSPALDSPTPGPPTPGSSASEPTASEPTAPQPQSQAQLQQPQLQPQPQASQSQPLQPPLMTSLRAPQQQPQFQQLRSPTPQPKTSQSQASRLGTVHPRELDPHTPQPAWNHQFERYLHLLFNEEYQLWYWNHHDGQSWVFFDWVPLNIAPPVPQLQPQVQMQLRPHFDANQASPGHAHQRVDSARAAEPLNIRQGKQVFGSYDGRHSQPDSHYEHLDPSFFVKNAAFFIEGRVFSMLFSEAAGANAVTALKNINNVTDYNSSISVVKYRENVHSQVRRFIVVKRKREFCFAVPIFTYHGQGTKKPGVSPDEHAIAFSHGYAAQLLPDEAPLVKHAICIVMNNGERPLAAASRIYFGIHHPIQYNVKVKDLGVVHQDWLPTFLGYWNMENISDTQQSNEITNEAAQDDYF